MIFVTVTQRTATRHLDARMFGLHVGISVIRAAVQGPFWVWMATLAGAIYAGYGLEW